MTIYDMTFTLQFSDDESGIIFIFYLLWLNKSFYLLLLLQMCHSWDDNEIFDVFKRWFLWKNADVYKHLLKVITCIDRDCVNVGSH